MTLSLLLAGIAGYCGRNAWRVVLIGLLLGLLSGGLAYVRLGVSTDTDALFAADLPWRKRGWRWTGISRSSAICSSP